MIKNMNIKKIGSVVILVAGLLTVASPAFALDLSKVQVKFSDNINKDCLNVEAYDLLWGCFKNNFVPWAGHPDLKPEPVIYIQNGLPAGLFPYVFLYNLSQYVTLSYSDQELAEVFNPAPTTGNSTIDIRRDAASAFTFWVMGGKLTPAKADFFRDALMK